MNPADAHALTMVAILAFALGSLVTMFAIMIHNGKRRSEELEFTSEEDEEPAKPSKSEKEPVREAWEKDGDWWKKH